MAMPYYPNYDPRMQQYQQSAPQYTPQYQQPQYAAPIPVISGRIVNDFSEITIKDIPTDGSMAYFIKSDGSEIQGRRWTENGNVVPVYYTISDSSKQKSAEDILNERIASLEERLEKMEKTKTRKAGSADE